ncbi:sensor histidine kinase [Sulfurospirillum barnesii]|uniref:histidine kinase n=1 Tax=Sulfurospirillum barnesii (strain ATCC 700032 / DSM 10660 / SES-3) TaxID=760154 RepID=I3XU19_SULBS|nr:ATP-binding protein [Sulfurospirillum barnesii]AFL67443.1 histidine kinase [Sulfurospirillum barnesii SES-3]
MLALKNWDINLRSSEKKTLWSFLGLYAFLTLLILAFVAFLYYGFERDLMLQNERESLSNLTNEQILRLKSLHVNFDKEQTYPRDERFNSAIYDSSLKQIFSTMRAKNVNLYEDIYLKNRHIYFIKELESYYLGARYIALEVPEPQGWNHKLYRKLLLYGLLIFTVLGLIGYVLLNLLLRPMRETIALLDGFIKDTTHELNTPINAILSNIEMIELESLDAPLAQKIKRMNIASKTISNLYDDLTYLVLSHTLQNFDQPVELKSLIEERIEYFSLLLESKKITLTMTLQEGVLLNIDPKKIAKLIDNVLSNAIKYNTIKGHIFIRLDQEGIEIRDSGRGIEEGKLSQVFERYSRFDKSVGGFGIGLNIVASIAKEYGLHVKIDSKPNEGTCVRISW